MTTEEQNVNKLQNEGSSMEELRDFYYSEWTAQCNNNHCHTVNGVKFTESVRQGLPCTIEGAVLVASALPQSNVEYNPELIRLRTQRFDIYEELPIAEHLTTNKIFYQDKKLQIPGGE